MKYIFFSFIWLVILYIIVMIISEAYYQGAPELLFRNNRKDTEAVLPENIKVVYSDIKKRYAVKIGDKYLDRMSPGTWWTTLKPYSTFRKSLTAKQYALQYIEDTKAENEIKNSYK